VLLGNGDPTRSALRRSVATIAVYGVVYLLADWALNRFAFSNGWTILWPLNGVTIALLIRRPRAVWPTMLLGIELGIGVGEYFDNNPLGSVIWQRVFSLAEVVICAALLPAFSDLEQWLRKRRIFPRFVAALLLGPAISGVMAALFFHIYSGQAYISAFDDWAAADALGIAAIMPLALSLGSAEIRGLFRWRSLAKTLGVLVLAFACAAVVFSVSRYSLIFLLYPALLLVDSLLAFSGSAIAVFGMSLIAVYCTTHGIGPFGVWPRDLAVSSNVALQLYLGFQLVALFPASLMIMERRRMGVELRDSNAQLLLLASLDGLTGLANRRSLDERFALEWSRAMRLRSKLALIMMDIDHFKQFNDIYGHPAGDQCLRVVAAALKAGARRIPDHLARFGGEEFAMLLPNSDVEGATFVAERLRAAVMELKLEHRGSSSGQVTISLGCAAIIPSIGMESSRLLQLADYALYEAKRGGRNRVHAHVSSNFEGDSQSVFSVGA
jgi:diguanylate cyclase (GGDEF)-like protein